MPNYISSMLIILLAMAILTILSSFLARYIVRVARFYKIKDILIAVLLLGIVGSLAELNLGITSYFVNYEEAIVGLVIGVTIAMILLVGGISIFYNKGIPIKSETHNKILPIFYIAVLGFILLLSDGQLSQLDGVILIMIFGLYIVQIFRIKESVKINTFKALSSKKELKIAITAIILILVNIFLTSGFAMQGIYNFIHETGVGLFIIGIALLAPFSVIPELFFELQINRHGTIKEALSDIVTSSITNLTLIIGVIALIRPFTITSKQLLNFNLFSLALIFVLFNIYAFTGKKLDRREGGVMLALYFVYLLMNYLLIAV